MANLTADLEKRLRVYADEINDNGDQITDIVEPEDILPLAALLREAADALSSLTRELEEAGRNPPGARGAPQSAERQYNTTDSGAAMMRQENLELVREMRTTAEAHDRKGEPRTAALLRRAADALAAYASRPARKTAGAE